MKYTLDPSTQRVTSAEAAGQTWTYAYSEAAGVRTVTITDPAAGATVARTNISTGLLTAFTDPLNHTTAYVYDSSLRVTKVTLPSGASVNYTYDARGNATQTRVKPPFGSTETDIVTSAAYPSTCANVVTCNQPTTTTDARGAVTNYSYDATHGGVTAVTLPAPASGAARPETRVAYETRYAWVQDVLGGYAPMSAGVVLPVSTSTCATGAPTSCAGTATEVKTSVTYGATGVGNNLDPTQVVTGAGDGSLTRTVTAGYDGRGDVVSVDGPLPGADDVTTYRYDDARRPVGVIGPRPGSSVPADNLNRAVRRGFDLDDAVVLVEQGTTDGTDDAAWTAFVPSRQVATAYDAYDRPTHQRVQAGGTTSALTQSHYDALGRVDCAVARMNPATFAAPPASACTAATAGAFGPDRISRTTYDAASQVASVTTAWGLPEAVTTSLTYTANGQPASFTDGNGNVSIQAYDGFDRPTRLRYPDATCCGTSTTDYQEAGYDAAGNVVSSRNRAGQTTTIAYDALNRPTTLDAPSGTMDVAYTYDNLGRVLTSTGNSQTLTNAWDPLSRLTSETGPLGAMGYQYDAAGAMTRITWPDTLYVAYDHDRYGAIIAVRENGASSGAGVLARWSWDSLGQLETVTRGNGVGTAYGYDSVGRLSSLAQNPAGTADDVAFGYGYNPAGQIVQRTVSNPDYVFAGAAGSDSYTLNGRNHVTAVDASSLF